MADADAVVELVQGAHTDDVIALEQKILTTASGGRGEKLDAVVREATTEWVKAFGGVRTAADDAGALARLIALVRARITSALSELGTTAASTLRRALPSAHVLGQQQAAAVWRLMGGTAPRPPGGRPPAALMREAGKLPGAVTAAQRAALALLRPALVQRMGLRGLLAPVVKSRAALDIVQAAVTRLVGGSVAAGAAKVTEAVGAPYEVWIAERDACARCLAYAGDVVATGQDFPGGKSMDPSQIQPKAAPVRPELHPHCRCKLVPYDPANHPPGAVTVPEAARREAERSVARGWSLGSESNASRLRATKHLLSQNPALPKSVLAEARRAVRLGKYPKGRDVPNPPPTVSTPKGKP